ncbi:hypothetical protein [Pseudonocardia sp.]|uniref:hypothetical protein n=1 Tax=Pseudonocardia sp. TaxID=60912 RepID=UPI002609A8E7|nr:hypothetical protein [Pseudonocardia sp.]MCW2718523.1 hypothetical protein [Pseudonocardia sp.]MDT7613326.1 hypothetical protein [Pseudonocardiales bacterium]
MIVSVDAAARPAVVALDDPDDCGRLHLAVTGDEASARQALEGAAVGTLVDRETAIVAVDAVRRMAQGRVGDDWAGKFSAMLAFAGTKGWLTDDGGGIQAHCEWQ